MFEDTKKSLEEQEAILINYLSDDEWTQYAEACHSEELGTDGTIEYELAKLMRGAMHEHHKANYPHSPICQWEIEMLRKPMIYWLFSAAQLDHVEAKYEYLRQIESPKNWDEIRIGYTELIEEHHHIDSYDRLAQLYSSEDLMNFPQIPPELDYERANELLKSAVDLGAEWLYRKILWNYDSLIKCGEATEADKCLFIEQSKPHLKHEHIELPKKYRNAVRPFRRKLKYKNVDFTNAEEIVYAILYGRRKPLGGYNSRRYLLQTEAAEYIESCIENKKKEILM